MTAGDPRTDPVAALAEAERLIAEAQASGATRLELRNLAALTALPSSLKSLANQLTELALIGCDQLADIEACAELAALTRLEIHPDFGDHRWPDRALVLASIDPIAGLTHLQALNLSGCAALTDVTGLQGLTGLQTLDLSRCAALTDVNVLQGLTGLQSLDLRWCRSLRDVNGLQGKTGLQTLDLGWCHALTDVNVLQGLTGLQSLDLSECAALMNVNVLRSIGSLMNLNLFNSAELSGPWLFSMLDGAWSRLHELIADRIAGVPTELCSSDRYSDNCLPRLQAWRADVAVACAPSTELKLFVLGNGTVGKTQICRRLRGEGFDPSVPSTHGIQLGEVEMDLPRPAGDEGSGAVTLRFWDFGGQDIYLGTHALFLDERAIYLIAWSPGFENTDETEQNGIRMANRPLAYWLEYVRSLAGPAATVMVVQTRCDRESDVRGRAPVPEGHGFEWLRETACSANDQMRPDGMDRLMVELKAAVRRQVELHGRIPMPASWAAMGLTLAGLREGRGGPAQKTITVDDFKDLAKNHHRVYAPSVLLEYLHRSGKVFWNQQAFGGDVVLQLDWALAGIYAVLDRDCLLPILRQQHGLFTPSLLAATVWQGKPAEEQKLLLAMMEKCRIAFKAGEDHYIAPAALPEAREVAERIERGWRSATPDASATLRYDFLHEGVLREMLCALGSRAGHDAVYWRHGLCFYDTQARSTLRIRSEQPDALGQGGWIVVEAAGGDAGALVTKIVESLKQIRIGREPRVNWRIHGHAADDDVLHATAHVGTVDTFAVHPGQRPLATAEAAPVYVSYAWGGESEALVDGVEQRLAQCGGIDFVRDKRRLRPGNWISTFMTDIGRAERVLVVLSDKYLRSPYCMRELMYLYQSSLGERQGLMGRVVPLIVGDLQIERAIQRVTYVKHWKAEDAALTEAYDGMDLLALGESDRAEWLAIKDFAHHVSDMVAWCADVLVPRGVSGIEAVCELLVQRAVRQ